MKIVLKLLTITIAFTVASSGPAWSQTPSADASTAIAVTVSLKRAALSGGQSLSIAATTTDPKGLSWTATAGRFSAGTSLSGVPVTYTAPTGGGTVLVKATSRSSPTVSASATVYVTSLGGVTTYHNSPSRSGANTAEVALSPATVNTATFGKLFSCPVDGAIYTQPLWLSQVTVAAARHNVVYVGTQHDSLYAFDGEASPCKQLWKASLIDSAHGATAGELPVPSSPPNNLVGSGYGDIAPEVGITGTPVIDEGTGTLYAVSKSMNAAGTVFYQRLHAIDIATGLEKFGGPANIGANITYKGVGDGSAVVTFNPRQQAQRPGLALVSGIVYVAWASHEDTYPYYGWVVGFKASTLAVTSILNVTPNVHYGGIWMGGGAPAVDNNNNLYVITGNGTFDASNTSGPKNDYGDSLLKLNGNLAILQHFTPSDQQSDADYDADFGSGGSAVVLNQPSGSIKHLVVGAGKDGTLFVLNGDQMGGLGDSNAVQHFYINGGIFSTGAFWNNSFYIGPVGNAVEQYAFDPSTAQFNTQVISQTPTTFGFTGASPSISSSGSSNGILWAVDVTKYCTPQSPGCGPAVLHAYDATNLAKELWNSSMVAADVAAYPVKFTVPTVANGHVYVGTRGNNTGGPNNSTGNPGQLDVYGIKQN